MPLSLAPKRVIAALLAACLVPAAAPSAAGADAWVSPVTLPGSADTGDTGSAAQARAAR